MRSVLVVIRTGLAVNGSEWLHRAEPERGPQRARSKALAGSVIGIVFRVPSPEVVADAEAEVNQRRDTDEQADEGVELVEGDDGDPAKTYSLEDWVAGEFCEGGEHGFSGGAGVVIGWRSRTVGKGRAENHPTSRSQTRLAAL